MYNLDNAAVINRSPEGFFLQGLVREEPRYSDDIRSSEFYAKWSKPGMVMPDAEEKRQKFVKRHLEVVKKCNEGDLRRVYELDYNKVMKIQKPKSKQGNYENRWNVGKQKNSGNSGNNGNNGNRPFSQKREFEGRLGKNKKYKRF